jgi:phosphosulfolactate synthase (CoM biosynthesis protein A)
MYNPFAVALLALEAQKVVELRLVKLAWGGAEAQLEAQQMVSEKISALIEASDTLMTGGSCETVVARYREHVAANTQRLTAAV